MERASQRFAWICIFGTVLWGCYTSTVVEPIGEGKDRMLSHRILYVVTKDSIKYVFDNAPSIINDTIVNEFRLIPISHVAYASIGDKDKSEKILPARISYLVTKDGTRYDFDTPPSTINGHIVGDLANASGDTTRSRSVAIPLAEVAFASDDSDTANWVMWVGATVVVTATGIALLYLAFSHMYH
jgi:hypothetical protein